MQLDPLSEREKQELHDAADVLLGGSFPLPLNFARRAEAEGFVRIIAIEPFRAIVMLTGGRHAA